VQGNTLEQCGSQPVVRVTLMVGESLPSGTRIDLTFIYFFHKENSIHNFCLSGSIYEFLHFHALFQLIDNNDYYISHGHFAHVAYA